MSVSLILLLYMLGSPYLEGFLITSVLKPYGLRTDVIVCIDKNPENDFTFLAKSIISRGFSISNLSIGRSLFSGLSPFSNISCFPLSPLSYPFFHNIIFVHYLPVSFHIFFIHLSQVISILRLLPSNRKNHT